MSRVTNMLPAALKDTRTMIRLLNEWWGETLPAAAVLLTFTLGR